MKLVKVKLGLPRPGSMQLQTILTSVPLLKDPAIPVESVLAYAANGFLDLLSAKVLQ